MNDIIYIDTPEMSAPVGAGPAFPGYDTRPGENKNDPANRGLVDDVKDAALGYGIKLAVIGGIFLVIAISAHGLFYGVGSGAGRSILKHPRKKRRS